MCNAVFLAAFLTILVGGLTLLRCAAGHSPNARLMIHALRQIEGPDPAPRPAGSHRPGRDLSSCAV